MTFGVPSSYCVAAKEGRAGPGPQLSEPHAQGSYSDLLRSTPASLACMVAPAVSGLSPETRSTRHSCGCLSVLGPSTEGQGSLRLWDRAVAQTLGFLFSSSQTDPSEMGQPCSDTPCSLSLSQHADWRVQQLAISAESAMCSVTVPIILRSSPHESPACPLLTFSGHCSVWGTKCPELGLHDDYSPVPLVLGAHCSVSRTSPQGLGGSVT